MSVTPARISIPAAKEFSENSSKIKGVRLLLSLLANEVTLLAGPPVSGLNTEALS